MISDFLGEIEVLVLRSGREVARVVRPLRITPNGPAVMYKRRLWPVNGKYSINIDEAPLSESAANGDPSALHTPKNDACAVDKSEADSQHIIINAEPSSRIFVDAAPGTGKTHVACLRVAKLINEGIPPNRIWMISFTRTAVLEIRNRLVTYLTEPADATSVRIATLDSHAWAIQSGFSSDATLTGTYGDNISATLGQIKTDPEVREYIGEKISHLIIDEAQDVIDVRARLVLSFIEALSPSCGITVFADRAQAIYGFTEDDCGATDGKGNLSDMLLSLPNLRRLSLTKVHRTQNPNLLRIYTEVRTQVLNEQIPTAKREALVKSRLKQLATKDVGHIRDLDADTTTSETLILMRRRCDVLISSSFSQSTPHRLRMSGLPPRLRPWLAEIFWDFVERFLTRAEFEIRWNQRLAENPELPIETAWKLLYEAAGESSSLIDVHHLRERLSGTNPPVLFTSPEYGDKGPILGTIHASKGREADDVILFLPPDSEAISEEGDRSEEIRVMFVGATRARNSLSIGLSAGRNSSTQEGRVWKRIKGNKLQIEIGRQHDLDAKGLVGTATFPSSADAARAQLKLQETPVMGDLFAHAVPQLGWKMAVDDSEKQRVCVLSEQLKSDLWEISKACHSTRSPTCLPHIRSMGLRTIVIDPNDAVLEQLHDPWRRSGFLFAPMLIGFSTTTFGGSK